MDRIPTVNPPKTTKPEYDDSRHEMRTFAQSVGCIRDGLTEDEAKSLRKALVMTVTDPPGLYFATVRSGQNLPTMFEGQPIKGPAAVFGGYALTDEQKRQAMGRTDVKSAG